MSNATTKTEPKVLVFAGQGLNCEAETLAAFTQVGFAGDIVHVDDVLANDFDLMAYQVIAVPGGFSYGDHIGAGKALANRLKTGLTERFTRFMEASDKLAIGICNGCQALVKSDLWQHPDQRQSVTLTANDHGTYVCRWVEVEPGEGGDAWFSQTPQHFALPIAHGEGRFMANDALTPALTYIGDNPNGSQQNCAALTGYDGRALVMMPHPERAIRFTQQPDWTSVREGCRRNGQETPVHGPGRAIFASAAHWFAR